MVWIFFLKLLVYSWRISPLTVKTLTNSFKQCLGANLPDISKSTHKKKEN